MNKVPKSLIDNLISKFPSSKEEDLQLTAQEVIDWLADPDNFPEIYDLFDELITLAQIDLLNNLSRTAQTLTVSTQLNVEETPQVAAAIHTMQLLNSLTELARKSLVQAKGILNKDNKDLTDI